jgi:hypothetical protein
MGRRSRGRKGERLARQRRGEAREVEKGRGSRGRKGERLARKKRGDAREVEKGKCPRGRMGEKKEAICSKQPLPQASRDAPRRGVARYGVGGALGRLFF